jgi:hypothetical protein
MTVPGGGSLVLANHAEFNGQCMQTRFDANEVKVWYEGGAELGDHALFWAQGEALVIVPEEVHPRMLEDVRQFFGTEAIDTVRPAGDTVSLCDRVGRDPEVSERVRHWLLTADRPDLLAWGLTPPLASFLQAKAKEGVDVQTPGIPAIDALWLVQSMDSKPGFRLLAEELSRTHAEIHVPEGFIVPDLDVALAAAEDHFLCAGQSVVIKAARGTGGYSTLLATPSEQAAEQAAALRRIRALARFDNFWRVGSVVVERFIAGPDGTTPTSYTVDARVGADGSVSVECLGRMLIKAGRRYDGAVIGRASVEPELATQLRKVTDVFGRALADRGFTGLFDLDFVVDAGGHAWVCEMNVRRASPSHLVAIAHRAFGPSWATDGAVFGRDYVYLQGSLKLTYDDLRSIAEEFRHQSPDTVDLLITQASRSLKRRSPYFGYALLGADARICGEEAARFENFVYSSLGLNLAVLDDRARV